jgi:uncharacterized protein YlxP (DUF503 family)
MDNRSRIRYFSAPIHPVRQSRRSANMDDIRVITGTLVADLVLAHARSIKERRKPLHALVQRLRNHDFSVAQVGPADLTQRVFLAVSAVAGTSGQLEERLAVAERMLFGSEFEIADLQRRITTYSAPSRR